MRNLFQALFWVLLCVPVWAGTFTTDAGDLTERNGAYSTSGTSVSTKSLYLKFAPSAGISGITAITLHINAYAYSDDLSAGSLSISSSASNIGGWDSTSNAATIGALSLTAGSSVSVSSTGWKTFTLTGAFTSLSALDTITVKLTGPLGSETTAWGSAAGQLGYVDLLSEPDDNHAVSFTVDPEDVNYPYLEITYTDGFGGDGEGGSNESFFAGDF